PAAREPDGLESAPLAVPAADLVQVRIVPAGPDQADPEQADPEQADPGQAEPPDSPAQPHDSHPDVTGHPDVRGNSDVSTRRNGTARHDDGARGNGTAHGDGAVPGENAGRARGLAAAGEPGPAAAAPVRPAATRLSGPANLDPVRNARYLAYVLRQAGLLTGVYLLIETVVLLCLLLSRAAGTTLGSALRLEIDSLWLVALALAILFWLIPVPALLAEWSLLMEQGSDAAQTVFEQINSAFQAHSAPLDSQRVRTVSRRREGDREYLELRRGHFSGYISCFAHGTDLYVGWTFWLHMSPLRLLVTVIGRNIRDATSQGNAIQRSLRFESARALVAAIHGATLAGIDAASGQFDPIGPQLVREPVGPQLVRETAIDMNFRLG
ncbi:MAG: hypothetical protein ACRDND_30880, partial [Streptosporangiaceae bacterium]